MKRNQDATKESVVPETINATDLTRKSALAYLSLTLDSPERDPLILDMLEHGAVFPSDDDEVGERELWYWS